MMPALNELRLDFSFTFIFWITNRWSKYIDALPQQKRSILQELQLAAGLAPVPQCSLSYLELSPSLMEEQLQRTASEARLHGDTWGRPVQTLRVKMVLLGSSGVGKSSLALRFVKNEFRCMSPTVGCKFTWHNSHFSNKYFSSKITSILFMLLFVVLFRTTPFLYYFYIFAPFTLRVKRSSYCIINLAKIQLFHWFPV